MWKCEVKIRKKRKKLRETILTDLPVPIRCRTPEIEESIFKWKIQVTSIEVGAIVEGQLLVPTPIVSCSEDSGWQPLIAAEVLRSPTRAAISALLITAL